jgi:hypothetical protein
METKEPSLNTPLLSLKVEGGDTYSTTQPPKPSAVKLSAVKPSAVIRRSSLLDVFGLISTTGSCCGSTVATFIVRLILLLPAPTATVGLVLLSPNYRLSIAADAIRIPLQVLGFGCLWISRFIVTASKNTYPRWGCFEIFEALLVFSCTMINSLLVDPSNSKHGLPSGCIQSLLVGCE